MAKHVAVSNHSRPMEEGGPWYAGEERDTTNFDPEWIAAAEKAGTIAKPTSKAGKDAKDTAASVDPTAVVVVDPTVEL